MKFIKKLYQMFYKPRIWLLVSVILIAAVSLVLGTLLLTQDKFSDYQILGYIFLCLMLLTVSYSIYGIIKILAEVRERLLKWSENRPFWNRFFTEYGFRAIFFTIGSFGINIAFAVFNGWLAIVVRSVWFGALAAYYTLLILFRGGILAYHTRRRKAIKKGQTEDETFLRDTKTYGICGVILVLLPIALSSAVLQMVLADNAFIRKGISIYVYAIYAFYKVIMASYNFVKTRKTKEMTVRAAKNINLADAFVSLLALQTAMFHEFETGTLNTAMMNAVTGGIVCALTAVIGVMMILEAVRVFRKNKSEIC